MRHCQQVLFGFVVFVCCVLNASSGLAESFLKTDLMFVGAHPDDETGVASSLTYFALGEKRAVACVYCTRGEGGGNMVGTQSGPALGALREAELRDALQIMGVRRVYFLDQLDWAYTESLAATLRKWNHEETLGRLVRMIRLLRPEVILTMNPAPTPGQHGHHQAAGVLAVEAFTAAADPLRFPAQLEEEGLSVWQPRKLYYGGMGATATQVRTDVALADSRYPGEIAGEAMSHHRSQAFGDMRNSPWMRRVQSFSLACSAVLPVKAETHLFDNIPGYDPEAAPILWSMSARPFFLPVDQKASWTWRISNLNAAPLRVGVGWRLAEGWRDASGAVDVEVLPGQAKTGVLSATPQDGSLTNQPSAMVVSVNGRETVVPVGFQLVAADSLEFEPRPAVAHYREWTAQQGTEAVSASFKADLPVVAGDANALHLKLRSARQGSLPTPVVRAPQGWVVGRIRQGIGQSWIVEITPPVTASGDEMIEATLPLAPSPILAKASLHPVPSASIRGAQLRGPVSGETLGVKATVLEIGANQLVQGNRPTPEDLSGQVRLAYDATFLRVQIRVRDDHVVSNIEPDDIKGHWRSDSVEICIDPNPGSEDTMGCYKVGIFPFDRMGRVRAARDADAHPGPVEKSSPKLQLFSKKTDDGYLIDAAIPWADIGLRPRKGQSIGFNVILYDGDKTNAAPGENINKTRLAWAPRSGVQGRPEDWGRLRLE